MVANDRKVARAILKLTNRSFDAIVYFSDEQSCLVLFTGAINPPSIDISLSPTQIYDSLSRLMRDEYIAPSSHSSQDFTYFRITDKLLHPFAFALDTFTKKFWGGYFAGLGTALAAWIIAHLPQILKLFQELPGLLRQLKLLQ